VANPVIHRDTGAGRRATIDALADGYTVAKDVHEIRSTTQTLAIARFASTVPSGPYTGVRGRPSAASAAGRGRWMYARTLPRWTLHA